MTETVKVVDLHQTKEDAYERGYLRFEDAEVEHPEEWGFHYFTESAEWANNVLPKLRAMAGYDDTEDGGVYAGTYQVERRVVLVEEPRDEPAEGDIINGRYLHDELVDCYRDGANDAALGREKGTSLEV